MQPRTVEPPWAEDERLAMEALQRGREKDALDAFGRVLAARPDHAFALLQVGQIALGHGDAESARHAFQRVSAADPQDPRGWTLLAQACAALGDMAGEDSALTSALKADPADLMALLLRGKMAERRGDERLAAASYGAAATVAPSMDRLRPDLRPAVQYAARYRDQYQGRLAAYLDERLQVHLLQESREDLERFKLSLDILVGRKQRYDSQPMRYYMPQLPPVEFFDREHFPWMAEVEAATDSIREEFLAVLRADTDFVPYIQYSSGEPVAQWAELNHSPRWSVYHLWKDGKQVAEHVQRCPITSRVLAATPQPDQPGRTPVALFSMLKPRTRIPPHVGASNARLICHLPLIVPEGCRYRVGNSHRLWVPGKAWVFDDTIEHEAINDSDQIRVVLIWDTWHPALTTAETRLITALNDALNRFSGADPEFTA